MIIMLILLLLFVKNVNVKALTSLDNDCENNGTCILLCNYKNEFKDSKGKNISRYISIYYNYSKNYSINWQTIGLYDGKPKIVKKGPKNFKYIFSKDGKNIYINSDITEENFKCPDYAFIDNSGLSGGDSVCFDNDNQTCSTTYSKVGHAFGSSKKTFISTQKEYDVFQQIDIYYNSASSILGDITCDDIFNNKYNPNDTEQVKEDITKDFKNNFLHGNNVPNFMYDYITRKSIVDLAVNAINEKKEACQKENDKQYEEGNLTDEEYNNNNNILDNIDPDTFADNVQNANENLPIEYPAEERPEGNAENVLLPSDVKPFNICDQDGVKQVFHIAGYLIFIAKLVVPLLLIIMGTVDVFSAIKDPDEKGIKDQLGKLIKRIIAAVIIFFIPTIINFAFSLIDEATSYKNDFSACGSCLFTPFNGDCNYKRVGEEKQLIKI